ncbi:MAG: GNAT family N-acetyltransferase [Actinomycetota bacterium]
MDDESLVRMETILLATWPPLETEERGGWVAGANGGFTGRANAVTVLQRTDPDVAEPLVEWAERWYRSRHAPPAIRLTPLSADLEPLLAERGYRWWRNGASVMAAELSPLVDQVAPDGYAAGGTAAADDDWYLLAGHDAADRVVLDRMFDGVSPRSLHVVMRRGEEIGAIGRGVVHDGHLAVFGMETAPAHRRRGLAMAVIGCLARWAADLGGDRATLQVETGNDGAHALYERLGFEDVYEYEYRASEP